MVADIQDASAVAKGLGEGHAAATLDVTSDEAWEAASPTRSRPSAGSTSWSTTRASRSPACSPRSPPTTSDRCSRSTSSAPRSASSTACARCGPAAPAGQGGAIINVASVAATIAFPGIAVYSATKSAVDRLTRVAAMESGKLGYGVRVNCIYPGLVPTAMGAGLANDVAALGLFPSPEEAVGAVIGLTPSGRLGAVEDMADAVVFLASDAARFITGAGLPVDGGMGM